MSAGFYWGIYMKKPGRTLSVLLGWVVYRVTLRLGKAE